MGLIKLEDLKKVDGSSYEFRKDPGTVVKPGEFKFASVQFEHGHNLYGITPAMIQAGAELKWIYDKKEENLKKAAEVYPNAKVARCLDEILEDPEVRLVTAADIPCDRGPLGITCMKAGKDYMTDKCPFTSLEQLNDAKKVAYETGRKYGVYYSERLCSECSMVAGDLIEQGAIGRVLNVIGLGPHRMGEYSSRPDWFFRRKQYGGIICDIGSHQVEQFLYFAGAKDAKVTFARACNMNNPAYPELEDFGEANMVADNGASFYFRVDWFTPAATAKRTFGDGRTMIIGTEGFIELRKWVDIGTEFGRSQLYLNDNVNDVHIDTHDTVGARFFGEFILDCINRTENAMTQEHAFKAAELCLKAQMMSDALA